MVLQPAGSQCCDLLQAEQTLWKEHFFVMFLLLSLAPGDLCTRLWREYLIDMFLLTAANPEQPPLEEAADVFTAMSYCRRS